MPVSSTRHLFVLPWFTFSCKETYDWGNIYCLQWILNVFHKKGSYWLKSSSHRSKKKESHRPKSCKPSNKWMQVITNSRHRTKNSKHRRKNLKPSTISPDLYKKVIIVHLKRTISFIVSLVYYETLDTMAIKPLDPFRHKSIYHTL